MAVTLGERGRDLTHFYYKSPYTYRKLQKAKWQHKNFDYTTIADRLRHGGVTCHDLGYGCAGWKSPEPHPIHIPGQVKNMTHSYTSHIENWPHSYTIFENWPHSYTIFQILPIHILFGLKKIPHWYTFDVKMIPIHILGGLKSIPHSSRTSVYTFIMEVTPPPPVDLGRFVWVTTATQLVWLNQ